MAYDFVSGDTGSKIQVTCKDNDLGTAINLTGATVTISWENASGTVVTKTMTITNAVSGIAEYQFLAGELLSGKMKFEIVITDAIGKIISNLSLIEVSVREQMA